MQNSRCTLCGGLKRKNYNICRKCIRQGNKGKKQPRPKRVYPPGATPQEIHDCPICQMDRSGRPIARKRAPVPADREKREAKSTGVPAEINLIPGGEIELTRGERMAVADRLIARWDSEDDLLSDCVREQDRENRTGKNCLPVRSSD
jgi:hypothetical protein